MAEVSLKISAEFTQAIAEFKKLESTSESARAQIKKFQETFDPASIDKFVAKNKLASNAITAIKGPLAGAKAEVDGLTKEMIKLQAKGLDPASKDFQKLANQLTNSREKMQQLQATTSKSTKSFGSLNKVGTSLTNMFKGLLIGFSVQQAFRIADSAIDSWYKQETAVKNVEAGLMSTKNAIGITSEEFQKMASATQAIGIFGDETILQNATAQFLTFGNIGASNFDRIQSAALDVTAKLKGVNATGEDLRATAIMMGKAMDDPVRGMGAMRRVGISFSSEEEKAIKTMVKHNDTIGAQNLMLQAIERQYGGTNEALRQTSAGMEIAAKNDLGDMFELLGKQIAPVKQALIDFTFEAVKSVKEFSDKGGSFGDVILNSVVPSLGDYYRAAREVTGALNENEDTVVSLKDKQKELATEYKKVSGFSDQASIAEQQRLKKEFVLYQTKIDYLKDISRKERQQMDIEMQRLAPKEPSKPSGGGGGGVKGQKKTEEQLLQERLNTMAMSQQAYEQQRLNTMQSFYDQRVALQGAMNEQEMASYVANETQKIAASKMTDDQKLAAMKALDVAVQKQHKANSINYTQFTQSMLGTTGGMLSDLQTVFKNAGKESKALAMTMKVVSAAQAGIASYLAFTETLANPALVAAFPANIIGAGVVLAAGLAKQAAIWSTPISGETGLTNYTVPDIRGNARDGAPVMAQGGETVSITPRGEDSGGLTEVNISIGENEIFNIIAKGIKTGRIDLNNKNIGRGVFAN